MNVHRCLWLMIALGFVGSSLHTPEAFAAKAAADISLEQLKQMIDASAHLTEEEEVERSGGGSGKGSAEGLEGEKRVAMQGTTLEALGDLPRSRRVLLDVRSNHSDGAHDMATLAALAQRRGIDVLTFGEHDRYTIRLGLDPVAGKLGISQEHPSLYETGLENFFTDLARVKANHPGMTFMAATESTPGYHWSGTPFIDLTLHDAERHIIAFGVEKPEQIKALPSYDMRNIKGNSMLSATFWTLVVFLLLVWTIRKRNRNVALLLALSCIALMAIWMMQRQVDPDVDFIEEAREQGLMTIWAHPGTLSGVRDGPMGVKLDTPPYNRRVFEAPTADAFAAVYGDTDSNTVPGGMWDRFMMDYSMGYRAQPIWGVAAGDYHAEGQANEYLGNYPMDVWADSGDGKDILKAVKLGRSVSWALPKDRNLRMVALFAKDSTGKRYLPGSEVVVSGNVTLYAAISEWVAKTGQVKGVVNLRGEWIVDGRVVASVVLPSDGTVSVTPVELPRGVHVVRLRIPMQMGMRMEANPFLLKVH